MDEEKRRYRNINNFFYALNNIFKWDKLLFFTMIILAITQVAIPTVSIYLPRYLIEYLYLKRPLNELLIMIMIFFSMIIVLSLIEASGNQLLRTRKNRQRTIYEKMLAEKSIKTDYENISSEDGQRLMMRAQMQLYGFEASIDHLMTDSTSLLKNLFGILIYIIILSILNPLIIAILFVCGAINFFAGQTVNKYLEKKKDTLEIYSRRLRNLDYETDRNESAKDVRIYNMGSFISEMYKRNMKVRRGIQVKRSMKEFWVAALDGFIVFIRDGLAYIYLIYLIINKQITTAEFVLYIAAIAGLSVWVSSLAQDIIKINRHCFNLGDLRRFFDLKDRTNRGEGIDVPDKSEWPLSIEFKNLSFSYKEKKIFDKLNLRIDRGRNVALVGINGAGKTTLIKLLVGLLRPDEGQILIDGKDMNEYNINEYFNLFSVVFQDAFIFAYPIINNISMTSSENTNIVKLNEVIKKSGLKEKIDSLDDGYNTYIERIFSDDGVDLSGGERQKVILARLLYHDAPFLILDEPSSSLDAIAESKLYNQYNRVSHNKTAFYISHRLASTHFCDEILFMENGAIIEHGSHKELMRIKGKYAHMFEVQCHYYKENLDELMGEVLI